MADVATNSKRKVATNSTRRRGKWVGRAEHRTTSLDGIEALPDHGNYGARSHVRDKTREERLFLQILVVFLKVLAVGVDELQGNQLEPALLEAPNDVTDETALDAVGLDHDIRAFVIVRHDRYFLALADAADNWGGKRDGQMHQPEPKSIGHA